MRGRHSVQVAASSAGPWTDLSCDTLVASVHHGRDDPDGQPEASAATVELYAGVPAGLDLGWSLRVYAGAAAGLVLRFQGDVTDLELDYDVAADPTTGLSAVRPFTRLVAVNRLASLGRKYVGDAPWPAELDGPRVARILALCGETTSGTTDPGTVGILARDVDRQPALDLCQAVADDAGGILLCDRTGTIRYHDAEHRRAAQPALTLDACEIAMSPTWTRDLSGLVNDVAIGYGPPAPTDQAVYTQTNAQSQARYGRVAYSTGSQLATLADATTRASDLLNRNAWPVWDMAAIDVVLPTLDDARHDTLLGLDLGALLGLVNLPAGAPNQVTALWIEGWTEQIAYGAHSLTLAVSGFCRTAPMPRWDDLLPAQTWDTLAGSWDDARCLGPVVSQGRWNDTPATITWATVDTAVTWDAWPY